MIDTTTGLPPLPDGKFWRVTRSNRRLYLPYSFERSSRSYTDFICGWVDIMDTRTTTAATWWGKTITTTEEYSVWGGWIETETKAAVSDQMHVTPKTGEVIRIHGTPAKYDYSITEDTIRAAAQRVYEKWRADIEATEKARAVDARIAALMGDYPPKTLGGTK